MCPRMFKIKKVFFLNILKKYEIEYEHNFLLSPLKKYCAQYSIYKKSNLILILWERYNKALMRRRKLILYYTSMKVKCETQYDMISIRFPVHTYYFVHFIPSLPSKNVLQKKCSRDLLAHTCFLFLIRLLWIILLSFVCFIFNFIQTN